MPRCALLPSRNSPCLPSPPAPPPPPPRPAEQGRQERRRCSRLPCHTRLRRPRLPPESCDKCGGGHSTDKIVQVGWAGWNLRFRPRARAAHPGSCMHAEAAEQANLVVEAAAHRRCSGLCRPLCSATAAPRGGTCSAWHRRWPSARHATGSAPSAALRVGVRVGVRVGG